ncbi:MAG: DUF2163 domain-containing protein [Beijerinckiaceae bacterium]
MRTFPPAFAAALASGATTHCRCWKTIRRDGTVLGFTDHDRDFAFSGVTFRAQSGLEASEAEASLGLAVGGAEIAGALMAEAITEADIASGLWDFTTVETWLVDWRDVTRRVLLDTGHIGEIRREGARFTAEIRSLAHVFDQTQGRRYTAQCDATLGDTRCGLDMSVSSRRFVVFVATVAGQSSFSFASSVAFSTGIFNGGLVGSSGGAATPWEAPVMGHVRAGGYEQITLWAPPPVPLAVGQWLALTVGCDKQFSTCRDRFANTTRFQGFPHIPGNDFVMSYAKQGEAGLDGGALK